MKSILIVQHGHFGQAYHRFAEGGPETYRDQKLSVDFVASFAPEARCTSVALGNDLYRTELAENLWAVGLNRQTLKPADIAAVFDDAAPTHVILRTPYLGFLRETLRRDLWLLPTFADIFSRGGPRTWLRNRALRRALLQTKAPCISNHSLNASRSLIETLSIPESRVIPWDWSKVPLAGPAKTGVADPAHPTAFFAGAVIETKGVGDCLDAIAALQTRGVRLTMRFAGNGDLEHWQNRANALGIADQVAFIGMISNSQVRQEMHAADFVIVPSRHSYAEGLPNTIYEGLASRSVLVTSDHPAFAGRLRPDAETLIFPAENPTALADCLQRASQDANLYHTLSQNAEQAHDGLYVGMEWTALVSAFLRDPANRTDWVAGNTLDALTP